MTERPVKFRVLVSPKDAPEFERVIRDFGWPIERITGSKEDASGEWARQANIARELVERFAQEQDPQIRSQINEGVAKLGRKVFFRRGGVRVRKDLNFGAIRLVLLTILGDSIPGELPKGVYTTQTKKGLLVFKTMHPSLLLPTEIIRAIETYGLSDGQPKSPKEISDTHQIGRNQGLSPRVYQCLSQNPKLRDLVIEQKPLDT